MIFSDILEIPAGKIQGIQLKTQSGSTFNAFYGIPYAEPPLNDLRFCLPKRLCLWPDILTANNKGIKSIQDLRTIIGQEDCLYLNIYSPLEKKSDLRPVMFFIHGGAFQLGDGGSELYGPDYFIDNGIVLVTINYRLGIFGFMTLRSDIAPGNLGLWDQKMALEWVRDNITEFGGDSNNITIFGESAGAASCMMHLVSPQSEGLFHKLIAQSGTFCSAYEANYQKRNTGKILAGKMGLDISNKTDKEILQILQNAPLSQISIHIQSAMESSGFEPFLFVPCIDDFSSNPFLPEDGLTLLKKGQFSKVPIMQGINRNEGLVFLKDICLDNLNNHWGKFAPKFLFDYDENIDRPDLIETVNEIKMFYFNGEEITEKNITKFTDLAGDSWFGSQLHLSSLLISAKSQQPLYRYVFDHDGKHSIIGTLTLPTYKLLLKLFMKKFFNKDVFCEKRSGVNHGDELIYLFRNELCFNSDECSEDNKVKDNIMKLWTSFASSSHPTNSNSEEWKPYSHEKPYEYYSIADNCEMKVSDHWYVKRIEFFLENAMKKF